jgi:hypothetical protein
MFANLRRLIVRNGHSTTSRRRSRMSQCHSRRTTVRISTASFYSSRHRAQLRCSVVRLRRTAQARGAVRVVDPLPPAYGRARLWPKIPLGRTVQAVCLCPCFTASGGGRLLCPTDCRRVTYGTEPAFSAAAMFSSLRSSLSAPTSQLCPAPWPDWRSRSADPWIIAYRGACPLLRARENGTELTSSVILTWSQEPAVDWHYAAPGEPNQNVFADSCTGRVDDECLNEMRFAPLRHGCEPVSSMPLDQP